MNGFKINPDWKILFELMNDVLRSNSSSLLLDQLFRHIGNLTPIDNGVAFIDYRGGIPYCTRRSDYPGTKVREFNSHYNLCCPVEYQIDKNLLGPVTWKDYKNSEYDTDFNRPLNIGYSLGSGFMDYLGKTHILVLHRTGHSSPFTTKDSGNLAVFIELFAKVYSLLVHQEQERDMIFKRIELLPGKNTLSMREAEICRMLCFRWSIKDIAARLGISFRTVECHCLHIYQKLNINNRRELAHCLGETYLINKEKMV